MNHGEIMFVSCELVIRVLESPSLDPIQIQLHLIHTLTTYYSEINFNTVFPSMPRSPK
jgi:hypothetical protein